MLTDERTDGWTDGQTEIWTPISHPAISRYDKNQLFQHRTSVVRNIPSNFQDGALVNSRMFLQIKLICEHSLKTFACQNIWKANFMHVNH